MSPANYRVTVIGSTARELIARRDLFGQVIGLVSQAVYLRAGDQIIWLGCNGVNHRRAILTSFDPNGFEIGMRMGYSDGCLWSDSGMSFDVQGARVWYPADIAPEQYAPRALVRRRLEQLVDVIQRGHPDLPMDGDGKSLAQVVPIVLKENSGSVWEEQIANPLVRAAIGPIAATSRACRDGDAVRVTRVGRELVGLGPGLTPSGDDFVGGLLFAAYYLKAAYPGTIAWDRASIDDFLGWARDKTNVISYAILRDHANGHGVDALHSVFAALAQGAEMGEVRARVGRLVAIGSTSGWDMLAGLIVAMLAVNAKA